MSYKLTETEINDIKTYLDFRELKQEDIRVEIIDHFSSNIEKLITEKELSFADAFNLERLKWNKDLSNHFSFWLGAIWTGPKMLIDKTAQHTKKAYLRMLLITAPLILLLFLLPKTFFDQSTIAFLNGFIGSTYLVLFSILLLFHFRMKKTKTNSSFRFLFKIHAIGIGIFYILYNPLISTIMAIEVDRFFWMPLVFHLMALIFSFSFFSWYKSHMNLLNARVI